jgi:uncharacterized protein with HEPN domain
MADSKDLVCLREMLDAAKKAIAFSDGRTRADLDNDEMFALAIVRLLEIIGEAAKGVSEAMHERYKNIPWSQMAGTRDRFIHGYFNVDHDIVWAIISNDLPPLITKMQRIISTESRDDG